MGGSGLCDPLVLLKNVMFIIFFLIVVNACKKANKYVEKPDVVPVARLEAFRALKLFRLESFRALKFIGQIGRF